MSQETKEHADAARRNLKAAEPYLEQAHKSAQKSGDGSLTKRVEKILKDTTETRTDLDQKLGGAQKGS